MESPEFNKLSKQIQNDVISKSFTNLLSNLEPEVAKAVFDKWKKDKQLFEEAVKEEVDKYPLDHWITKSCKHCYERGYIGILLSTKEQVICRCVKKNYSKWLISFREEFNKNRGDKHVSEDTNEETKSADRS